MKFHSISLSIGLSVLSNLFSASLPSQFGFNSPRVLAQTADCPLPADVAVTFLNSKCKEVILTYPQTFYRYYSDDTQKIGRFVTTDKYETNLQAIRNLALNQVWGNKATLIERVTLPAGTTVYLGKAAPQNPPSCYPGGGQQTWFDFLKVPDSKWSVGRKLYIEDFSCP
ncbi:hypothetical protein H6G93_28335 [Nostoc sp. FACHB-973]|nr:hypothetical protein [Nostoc sp. FACHB-973]